VLKDRAEAGQRLAGSLGDLRGRDDVIVAGIPREGVVIAAEAARALGVAQVCLVVCRIGMPCFPELTLGAVDADGEVTFDPSTQLTRQEVRRIGHSVFAHIEQKVLHCRGDKPEPDYAGKTVVVVDEAAADELVPTAAAAYLRRHDAARVVLAAPVVVQPLEAGLREHFDDVVALDTPRSWRGAEHLYEEHRPLSDAEIEAVLKGSD
jgi:predicted phosphoribosyltransferase